MKKITTQPKTCNNYKEQEEKVVAPSEQTIDFLKTFARTFYADKKLPLALNGVILN